MNVWCANCAWRYEWPDDFPSGKFDCSNPECHGLQTGVEVADLDALGELSEEPKP